MKKELGVNPAKLLASVTRRVSQKSVNSACSVYFHEPKQPKELERLKKIK